MKVRVLYPTALQQSEYEDALAGDVVDMDADLAKAHIAAGNVEPEKPARAKKEE